MSEVEKNLINPTRILSPTVKCHWRPSPNSGTACVPAISCCVRINFSFLLKPFMYQFFVIPYVTDYTVNPWYSCMYMMSHTWKIWQIIYLLNLPCYESMFRNISETLSLFVLFRVLGEIFKFNSLNCFIIYHKGMFVLYGISFVPHAYSVWNFTAKAILWISVTRTLHSCNIFQIVHTASYPFYRLRANLLTKIRSGKLNAN